MTLNKRSARRARWAEERACRWLVTSTLQRYAWRALHSITPLHLFDDDVPAVSHVERWRLRFWSFDALDGSWCAGSRISSSCRNTGDCKAICSCGILETTPWLAKCLLTVCASLTWRGLYTFHCGASSRTRRRDFKFVARKAGLGGSFFSC